MRVCASAFAVGTFELQQVRDGVRGCVQVGRMDLILLVNRRVKITGEYYRELLLTQKLLSVMREICGEFFIFQQDNVPAHRARETINLLECTHFTRPLVPTAQISTVLNTTFGEQCGIANESS